MIALRRVLAESRRVVGRIQAFAIEPREPPREIQLWSAGDNPTDYGVHRWTERSLAEVCGRYNERGNPLLIDIEHNGAKLADSDEPTTTGGYARLEIRRGEPWLTFEWSDFGAAQIQSGQRRFLSPEYDVDPDTGEITALYRVSLVADPGTHRARMLAAANTEQGQRPMTLAMVLAALRAALAAEDPAVVKESITNLVNEISPLVGDDAPADTPAGDDPEESAPTDNVIDPTIDATSGQDLSLIHI